jgi:hypothetical protein
VNTAEQMGARCHWCRHVLTVNEQMPNGAVPDAVLPFTVTHDRRWRRSPSSRRSAACSPTAPSCASSSRRTSSASTCRTWWSTPTRAPTSPASARSRPALHPGHGRQQGDVYDADVYSVDRHVDFTADDLTIEASSERAQHERAINTNNIINTILPFDTENAVKWNASYLTGFTSEKRDQDVAHTTPVSSTSCCRSPVPRWRGQHRAVRPGRALGAGATAGARHPLARDVPAGLAVLLLPREERRRAWCTTSLSTAAPAEVMGSVSASRLVRNAL